MKSLYLKYRPQNFDEVLGQEIAKKILINSLISNNINHAYLFYGIRGTGKTTLARIFSKSLNCENIISGYNPCNECSSCKEINNETNLDVIEIDAASNNGVDEIREIRNKINYSTTKSKYKIYIIDEVHMLTKQAFNALLKTLEEPPKNVIFILATTELNKIPETILSRTIIINISNIDDASIEQSLKNIIKSENIEYEKQIIDYIKIIANGSIRDAISFLETCILFDTKLSVDNVLKALGLISFEDMEQILIDNKYFLTYLKNQDINFRYVLNLLTQRIIEKILSGNYRHNDLLDKLINIQLNIQDPNLIRNSLYTTLTKNNENDFGNDFANNEINKEKDDDFYKENLKKIENKNINKDFEIEKTNNKIDNKISSEKTNQFKSKYITDFINTKNYLTILFNNDSQKVIFLNKKWDFLTSYAYKTEWREFVSIVLDAKIVAFAKQFGILLLSDRNYDKFKTISLNKDFTDFSKKLFSEKIYLFPIKNFQWNQLTRLFEKTKNEGTEINEWANIDILENQQLEKLKNIFGDKLEI